MNFSNLLNLRKITDDFRKHLKIETDHWSNNHLKVELTTVFDDHEVGYGLNGNSQLVEFRTKLIEAKDILITRSGFSKSGVEIYLQTSSLQKQFYFYEFKDAKGKRVTRDHLEVDSLKTLFGYSPEEVPKQAEVEANGNVLQLAPDNSKSHYEAVEEFYENLLRFDINDDGGSENFEAFLARRNWKLVKKFAYSQKFSIFSPVFVNKSDKSLEIGWNSNFTYYSHPITLKITKVNEVKRVNLAELGVETRGYYDHHVNMYVRPEQVKAVKAFKKRFDKLSKQKRA